MGVMMFHVASIAALFVDQAAQAPVADLGWKQWIPTGVSLLSIGIGVWIANRSMRKSKDLTEWSFRAASERDHERWILDQKKAEWKELLASCDEVGELCFPPRTKNDTLDVLIERVQNAHRRLHYITSKYIFIAPSIDQMGIREFVQAIGDGAERLESLRFNKRADIRIPEEYSSLIDRFQSVAWSMRNSANLDLGIWKKDKNGVIVPTEWDKYSQ
ncbi:MAG: hypothetical protein WBE38_04310 [Terracidiphilus sp.]